MKFKTGDLVHIPAGTYRLRFKSEDLDGQMCIPWDCNIAMEPLMGIYKEQANERESVIVFFDGEWVIENNYIYLKNKGARNVRTNQYNESRRTMVS
tara:strand:- start:389 stop:676 length:288 start_codon:yes stop_codon:yes gene_type:complete